VVKKLRRRNYGRWISSTCVSKADFDQASRGCIHGTFRHEAAFLHMLYTSQCNILGSPIGRKALLQSSQFKNNDRYKLQSCYLFSSKLFSRNFVMLQACADHQFESNSLHTATGNSKEIQMQAICAESTHADIPSNRIRTPWTLRTSLSKILSANIRSLSSGSGGWSHVLQSHKILDAHQEIRSP